MNVLAKEVPQPPPQSPFQSVIPLISYMLIFFIAMIGHELALEGVSKQFPELNALASTVTLFQFGFCFGLPLIVSGPRKTLETFPKTLPACFPFIKLSLVVFGATCLATRSLMYVSFPTKVIFKSAKLIPTMIVATFLHPEKSRYGPLDYLSAALICAGAAGYGYGSGRTSSNNDSSIGLALLTASIACDALVPNLQQRLMAPAKEGRDDSVVRHGGLCHCGSDGEGGLGLSAAALMVNVNAVGFGGLLAYMFVSGSLWSTVNIALEKPILLGYLSLVGLGLSIAVLAYTKLIKASGSVVAVAVATLRKVATIVLSYLVFPKPLLSIHILSGLSVLAGILLSTLSRKRNHS